MRLPRGTMRDEPGARCGACRARLAPLANHHLYGLARDTKSSGQIADLLTPRRKAEEKLETARYPST